MGAGEKVPRPGPPLSGAALRRGSARSALPLPSPLFSPQENHPQAPRGPLRTPLKQAGGSQRVLAELQPGCQPLATPPKPGEALPAEPWTPTANLKVLISAVSPEIRSREQSRGLQGARCCQVRSGRPPPRAAPLVGGFSRFAVFSRHKTPTRYVPLL